MSERLWWKLPGPTRFIERLAEDLRDGKNLIVTTPLYRPGRLGEAVRTALGSAWDWHRVSPPADEASRDNFIPAARLLDRFAPDRDTAALPEPCALAAQSSLAGLVIWIEDLPAAFWPAWRRFVQEYQHACKSRDLGSYALLGIVLSGVTSLGPPADDACLVHRRWSGVVDRLDMLLYAAHTLRGHELPEPLGRLAVSVAAHLALWDPEVCDLLAETPAQVLLDPRATLRGLAERRGWSARDVADPRWELGSAEVMDGVWCVHSASLIVHDPGRELERRIWAAQVGVLLPFVEEGRRLLLERHWEHLEVPFEPERGMPITERSDLEIGHIEYQLSRRRALGLADSIRHASLLKKIRNDLSHLRPLEATILLGEAFRGTASQILRGSAR